LYLSATLYSIAESGSEKMYVRGADFSDVALEFGQVNKTGVDESFDLSGRLGT